MWKEAGLFVPEDGRTGAWTHCFRIWFAPASRFAFAQGPKYSTPMTTANEDPRPIVVADDNADDLFFARRSLEKAGAGTQILTCENGQELVSLLKTMTKEKKPAPRAVFLDVKMPLLDGFETLKWIRSQKHLEKTVVVMLSGSAEVRDIARAKSLGADDYLVKFPGPDDFSRVMSRAAKPA